MDKQSFLNAQKQVMSFKQPAASVSNSTALHGGANIEQKARFTRVERRKFAKEKKAHQKGGQSSKKTFHKTEAKIPVKSTPNVNTIDNVIATLLTLRNNAGGDRKVQGSLDQVKKTLEQRITRDAFKKNEPSAKKLEKIQKRKEIRAERRKAKLALRAQQQVETQAAKAIPTEATPDNASKVPSEVPAKASAPVVSVSPKQQQLRDPEIDAINFDEL